MHLNKKFVLPFLCALIFSLYHSIHVIYPIINYGSDYLPVKYGTVSFDRGGDDFFYFTYVREIIDGNLLIADPITKENNVYSIYNFNSLNFLIAGLFGSITKSTTHAYIASYLILPFCNYLSIYFLVYLFTRNTTYSIIITFFSFYFIILTNTSGLLSNLFSLSSIYKNQFKNVSEYKYIKQKFRFPNKLYTNI